MKIKSASAFLAYAALVSGFLAAPSRAGPLETEIRLTHSDALADDHIGQAVAISGNVAIGGVDGDDDAGNFSGSAFLFDATTGEELFKLTPSDGVELGRFGHSVVIDGNRALVGAFGDDDQGPRTGAAYLFDVTTGQQLMKWTASDATQGDQFGHGIGISGNRAIVGSYFDDDAGNASGSAYIFDVTTGDELFKLTASDAAPNDWFGYWTAINGNIAVVGSRRDDDNGTNSGSVYLFDVTTGDELLKLTASDGAANDEFGYAVAIDGNRVIVGTWGDNLLQGRKGAAYVFDATTGEELFKLTASDGEIGDEYGYAVDISGNTAIVGADGHSSSDPGSAYLYDLTFGDELFKLVPSDPQSGGEFGTAVGISGDVAFSGAWLADGSVDGSGSVYLFDVSSAMPPGADFNNDGTVDGADLALWESSSPIPRLDANSDDQVDGSDFLQWQRSFVSEVVLDESPANLDQQGAVDGADLSIWEQSFGVDGQADLNNDGDSDGGDFLVWQRELTPGVVTDVNNDRLVDGEDLEVWASSFGWDADINGDGLLDGDANGDGLVTQLDFLWWQEQSGNSGFSAASTQVPEPASFLLLLSHAVVLIFRATRSRRN